MISAVLVAVDMGFAGGGSGFAGGWDEGGTGVGVKINGVIVGTTRIAVVTRGVTCGSRLATGWELEGGNGVLCLGGDGRDAGLTVY